MNRSIRKKVRGVNILGKNESQHLSNLSKISIENEILSQRGGGGDEGAGGVRQNPTIPSESTPVPLKCSMSVKAFITSTI